MGRRHWWIAASAVTAIWSAPAAAQDDDGRWAFTPYAGVLMVDDGELDDVGMELETSIIVGARAAYTLAPRWEVEWSYGYAPLSGESAGFGEIDGNLHAYALTLGHLMPVGERARFRLSAGVGGVRYGYDEFERDGVLLQDESWAHELVVPVGAGFELDVSPRLGFRFDARDLLQFCQAEEEPIEETEDFSHCPLHSAVLSNPEFTAGVAIRP